MFIHIQRSVAAYNRDRAAAAADNWAKAKKKCETANKLKSKIVKTMTIVPICKYKRKHLLIDADVLYRIMAAKKILPKKVENPQRNIDFDEFYITQDTYWNLIFDINKINRIQIRHKK